MSSGTRLLFLDEGSSRDHVVGLGLGPTKNGLGYFIVYVYVVTRLFRPNRSETQRKRPLYDRTGLGLFI